MNNRGCTVTILRPKETGYLVCNSQPEYYNAYIDDWLDFFREQLEMVAKKHRVPLHLYDHQLTAMLPDHREKRWIGESDVLTVVNPKGELIEEVERWMRRNPILRTIMGFSSVLDRDTLLDLFRKFQIPLLHPSTEAQPQRVERAHSTISRIFTVQVQEEERIPSVVTRALLYPLPLPPTVHPTATSHEG